MDPAAAAQAMITKQDGYDAIIVWNPFVLETLKKRQDAKVLFDSTGIPGEIIDMVVMAQASLDQPGGEAFAKTVAKTYYELNKMLADPATGDATLVALGAKFSSLELEKMKVVVQQTKFYKTPAEGIALFDGTELPGIMKTVVGFCRTHDIVASEPAISYPQSPGGSPALLFTDKYMKAVQ
jgi:NitT/TauT family transport system substrate-binding protein